MSSRTEKHCGHPIKLALALLLAGVACLVGAVLAINVSPRLLFGLLGLRQLGSLAAALPSEPAAPTLNGEPLDHVDILLPPQLVDPLTLTSEDLGRDKAGLEPLIGDTSVSGTTRYLLTVHEDKMNEILWEVLLPEGLEKDRYHDLAVDLQPGGLIVSADVDLGIRRQRMGLLMLYDPETLTLFPGGLVVNETLYAMPEAGSPARALVPAGRQAQRVLHALTIVGPLPGEGHVEMASFQQDELAILVKATYAVPRPADTGWQLLERGVELREIDVAMDAGQAVERLSIVRFNPANVQVRVRYDPKNPKTMSAWGTTTSALLVVNGGYFAPESEGGHETIGLLISDGQRSGALLQDYAGMLTVTETGDVSVRWLRHRPYDPRERLAQAVQSFPMLVKPGGKIGFPTDADDGTRARRTVVAQDDKGNILLIVAPRGRMSLHELAVFLIESDLAIDVALNLDGGGSTGMWLATAETHLEIDSFTPVPSVIVVQGR